VNEKTGEKIYIKFNIIVCPKIAGRENDSDDIKI
jgi:hypothetical protein